MKLKTLEIKGFKSFAEETIIHFNEDVIGIVGPNGSGKSNIVDAIRWVLGEQKGKELRLDKMSSVIFNGTRKRKEASIASVTLTFENTKNILPTEYQTVAITRMLYRSGDSEYRLNGVTCRLKDITNLFLDTGIGSNSYAIIALGMVDDILNDRENYRRNMLEQAAGVSKYKIRKHETLNKLNVTQADLERVDDLLHEIDGQLSTLEKQAKRTEKYYELKEEYKGSSIKLATFKIAGYKVRYKKLQGEIDQSQVDITGMEAKLRELEAEIEKQKKVQLDQEVDLSEKQKEVNALVNEIRNKENDIRILDQKATFIQQNKDRLSQQNINNAARLQDLEEQILYYRGEIRAEEKLEEKLSNELEQKLNALNEVKSQHGGVKNKLDELISGQQVLEREIFEIEKSKAIKQTQLENSKRELEKNKEEITNRSSEIKELESQVGILKVEEDKISSTIMNLVADEETRAAAISQTEKNLETERHQSSDVSRKLDRLRNEYKLTKSMVESMEGYPDSIKFLSSQKSWSDKTMLLSDLLSCDEKYKLPLENYLEPYLNYFVVESREKAMEAIKLLSQSQKGKANFFILSEFEKQDSVKNIPADAISALSVVDSDKKYDALWDYLLNNVLLVPEEKEEMFLKSKDDFITVSLSGRLTSKKLFLSGGSVGLFEGKKIGRRKNLEALELEIKELESTLKSLEENVAKWQNTLKELKGTRKNNEIDEAQKLLNKIAREKSGASSKLESFQGFLFEIDQKNTFANERIDEAEVEIVRLENSLHNKKKELEHFKSESGKDSDSFKELSELVSTASTAYNEINISLIRQQNKIVTFANELSFREKQASELRDQIHSNTQTLNVSDSEVAEAIEHSAELKVWLSEKYEIKKNLESNLSVFEQDFFGGKNSLIEKEDLIRKLNRSYMDAQVYENKLKDEFNEIKLSLTGIGERLRVEFSISINELINQNEEVEMGADFSDLEKSVDKLKNRLDNYGEINPMAVEAYTEMKERFDTITTQKDDILQAKDSLMQTIQEIEETATKQFLEAFAQVRKNFIEIFRTLFTEQDSCDLILTNPDAPLDTDIQIIAKPKGKKPQSISQLSGGEKTLTATALLFALYLLKPAPFCIFDEVDAPLDDANIEKFNKIIKRFSSESQFIIVTHNKATMSAVDVIYGVYMEEQGVSAVTPVDFRTFENTTTFEAINN
jgi:chromosome segregation protein